MSEAYVTLSCQQLPRTPPNKLPDFSWKTCRPQKGYRLSLSIAFRYSRPSWARKVWRLLNFKIGTPASKGCHLIAFLQGVHWHPQQALSLPRQHKNFHGQIHDTECNELALNDAHLTVCLSRYLRVFLAEFDDSPLLLFTLAISMNPTSTVEFLGQTTQPLTQPHFLPFSPRTEPRTALEITEKPPS